MDIVQQVNYGRLYNSSPEYIPQVAVDDTLFTRVGKHNQTDNQKCRMSKILRQKTMKFEEENVAEPIRVGTKYMDLFSSQCPPESTHYRGGIEEPPVQNDCFSGFLLV